MIELKNVYSVRRKQTKDYSEFDYRRIFIWVDFLLDLKEIVKNQRFLKEEIELLNNKIIRGYRLQLTLERSLKDYETYQEYYSDIAFNISLQDDIINSIYEYLDELKDYIKTEEPKGNTKRVFKLEIDE